MAIKDLDLVIEKAMEDVDAKKDRELISEFDELYKELEETHKSRLVAFLIVNGYLVKDPKTGKLKKTDKKISTKDAFKQMTGEK